MSMYSMALLLAAFAAQAGAEAPAAPAPSVSAPPATPATAPVAAEKPAAAAGETVPVEPKRTGNPGALKRALMEGRSIDSPEPPAKPIDPAAKGKAKLNSTTSRVDAPSREQVERQMNTPKPLGAAKPVSAAQPAVKRPNPAKPGQFAIEDTAEVVPQEAPPANNAAQPAK
jgi:hypothetical protein